MDTSSAGFWQLFFGCLCPAAMSAFYIAVMHPHESVLLLQDMEATPGELLREALGRAGSSPTELGKKLGFTTPYQTVKRWIDGRGFNPENQRRAAVALGLPSNYFEQPDDAARRERHRLRIFAQFLHTEIGTQTSPEQRRVLESVRFPDKILPSVNLYIAWALALQEKITFDQVPEVAAENDALDRELEEHRRKFEAHRKKREGDGPDGEGSPEEPPRRPRK